MQYLKQYGEQLVALGYRIVPLPPGSKGPRRKGWQHFEATPDLVRQWTSNGSVNDGVGVLGATTPAIDVDIMDPDVAEQMSRAIDEIFPGQALMTRTGLAPKFLVPFRSDEPFRKLTSKVYTDGQHDHKVEVLGDGQQWVAYHVHPDTQRPYVWFDGVADGGIADVAHDALPVLDRAHAQQVIDAFELLAQSKVSAGAWRIRSGVDSGSVKPPSEDPFGTPRVGRSAQEVDSLLARLPNADVDYEQWFQVLAAVHHELGEAGESAALAWSQRSGKHTDERFEKTWGSLGHYTGRVVTLRTLLKAAPPKASSEPFAVHAWADYKQGYLSTPWIIKGVLPQAEVGILFGPSGSGKTFFALDLAATVAAGSLWRGRRVAPTRVVYVASEAREGIKKRMDAYDQFVSPDGARPSIIAQAPNLLSLDVQRLAEAIGRAGLIIVDTMAASHSGDENSAQDMGLLLAACKDLSTATGAMILLVHHTGKDDAKGMRGSSALLAGADFAAEVFKEDDGHTFKVVKQKDGEIGEAYGFSLKRVVVGTDDEGEEVTTCVIEAQDHAVQKAGKQHKQRLDNFETSDKYQKPRHYLRVIEELVGLGGANVDEADVISAIQADETVNPLKEPEYPRGDNIKRTLLTLASLGRIKREGRWIRLCG